MSSHLLDEHPELTALLLTHLGSARLWAGCFKDARAALTTVAACSGGASTALPREESLGHLALIDYLNGWLGRAERKALAALGETERFSLPQASGSGIGLLVLAAVAVDRNELGEAQALLDAAADTHRAMRDPVREAGRAIATARLLLARGNPHAAIEAAGPAVAADVVSPGRRGTRRWWPPPHTWPKAGRRRPRSCCKRCPTTSRRVRWGPRGPSSPRAIPARRSTCSTGCTPRAVSARG